jgi:hypothetical protein
MIVGEPDPRVLMYEKEDRTSVLVQKRCTFLRRVLSLFNGNLLNDSSWRGES